MTVVTITQLNANYFYSKEQLVINWDYLAVNFIKQAGRWNRQTDVNTCLRNCIDIIKRLTGAHVVLYIALPDGKAVIKYATTPYLQDVTVNEPMVAQLLAAGEPVFKADLLNYAGPFSELFPALCSAAFIPVDTGKHTGLVAIGWSAKQDFDHSFASFTDVVQLRIKELVEMTELYDELVTNKKQV